MTNYATIGRSASEPQPTAAEREAAAKSALVEALVEGRAGARECYISDNYEEELCERITRLAVHLAGVVTDSPQVSRDCLREVMEEAAWAAVARGWAAYRTLREDLAVETEGAW